MDFTTKSAGNLKNNTCLLKSFKVDASTLPKIFTVPRLNKAKKIKKSNPFNVALLGTPEEPNSGDSIAKSTNFELFKKKHFHSKHASYDHATTFNFERNLKTPEEILLEEEKNLTLKSVRKVKFGQVCNTITGEQVKNLLNEGSEISTKDTEINSNVSANQNTKNVLILDCRFYYEYQGGHIQNAIRFDDPPELIDVILKNGNDCIFYSAKAIEQIRKDGKLNSQNLANLIQIAKEDTQLLKQAPIIIFYCEFSSQRAPKSYSCWRTSDRDNNIYPKLSYDNIYLLEGGYSKFVGDHPFLCTDSGAYVKMSDPEYSSDLTFCLETRKNHEYYVDVSDLM